MIPFVCWVPSYTTSEQQDNSLLPAVNQTTNNIEDNIVKFLETESENETDDDSENIEENENNFQSPKLSILKKRSLNDFHLEHENDIIVENESKDEKKEDISISASESNSDSNTRNDFSDKILKNYANENTELAFLSTINNLLSSNVQSIAVQPNIKRSRFSSTDILSDSELDDVQIKSSDEIFITLETDECRETFSLQMHIFDSKLRTFYVHHDIILSSFPLCCQPISFPSHSNLIAIGGLEESIEIYNLDDMNAFHPLHILGGRQRKSSSNAILNEEDDDLLLLQELNEYSTMAVSNMSEDIKELVFGELHNNSHTSSILCLDWHSQIPHRLISASADNSIKIWNLNTFECEHTLRNVHTDKIHDIKIHPTEPNILLSASFDKSIVLCDLSTLETEEELPKKVWKLNVNDGEIEEEAESICWYPQNPALFFVSLNNGCLACFDSRLNVNEPPVWKFKAHLKAVTCMSFNERKPELFITGSLDKTAKLWYCCLSSDSKQMEIPQLLACQKSQIGRIFSCAFAPATKIPWIAIFGGMNNMAVWDIMSCGPVRDFFKIERSAKAQELEAVDVTQHRFMEQPAVKRQKILSDMKEIDSEDSSDIDNDSDNDSDSDIGGDNVV